MKKPIRILCLALLLCMAASPVPAAAQQQTTGDTFIYLPVVSTPLPAPDWIGPFGGSVVCISYQPQVQGLVYVGTWGGGVYKSTDSGAHWSPASSGLDNLYINSLAVDPSNADVLYAGTYSMGIYKSTNGGDSWTAINSGIYDNAIVYTIAVTPHHPDRLYIGTRPVRGNPPWGAVAYRSTDGGASWAPMLSNVGGSNAQDWVYSVAVNQVDSNRVLAATHEHGPYLSQDYGQTWKSVSINDMDGSGRAVVFDPRYGSLFTAYYGVWHLNGVYKTTDNAASWTQDSSGLDDAKIYSMGLAIAKLDPNVLYAASFYSTYGLYKTSDAATSWSPIGFKGTDMYSVAVNPFSTSQVLAGSADKGLYRSTDGGQNWSSQNQGIGNTNVSTVLARSTNQAELAAGVPGSGVLHSTNGGATWSSANSGLSDSQVNRLVADPAHPDVLYALTASGGLFKATWSGGLAWSLVSSSFTASTASVEVEHLPDLFTPLQDPVLEPNPNAETQAAISNSASLLAMAFSPSDSNVIYLGGVNTGVYKSSDDGSHWSRVGLSGQSIQSLAVDPTDSNLVYAATNASGAPVQVSANGGATWASAGLSGVTVNALAISPLSADTLFAATSSGIYRMAKGSTTWVQIALSGTSITTLAASPTNASFLLAGTTDGIYQSLDGGTIWTIYSNELNGITVRSINFDPSQPGYAYISSTTRGAVKIGFYP